MSRYMFLFDLDSTITRQEILPAIAQENGRLKEMRELTERTMRGEIPFKQSFLQRVSMLQNIPVSAIKKTVGNIALNEPLVDFIQRNRERCYIITGNLDVWIETLLGKIGIGGNVYSSRALVRNDFIEDVLSIVDKNAVISQMTLPFVAVGDGSNDAEMIQAAEIGVGYGGVRDIAAPVLECATHAIYNEEKLVEFLNRLL